MNFVIESYDTCDDNPNWKNVTTFKPYSSSRFSGETGVVLNNELHVLGGVYNSTSGIDDAQRHHKYDINTNEWSQVSTIPERMEWLNVAVALDGEIHIINKSKHYKYNPNTGEWTKIGSAPSTGWTANPTASAVVLDRKIYLIGYNYSKFISNSDGSQSSHNYFDGFKRYNPDTNTWGSLTNVPFLCKREYYSSCVLNGEIHIVGWNYNSYSSSSSLYGTAPAKHYKYNPSTDTWTELNDFPCTYYVGRKCMVVLNEQLHVYGCGNGNNRNYHYKYNPSTDTWTSCGKLIYSSTTASGIASMKNYADGVYLIYDDMYLLINRNIYKLGRFKRSILWESLPPY